MQKKNYMYNIHVQICIEFSCVMQRAREAAVIVQAESDTGKASMHDAGGRGAQSVRSSGIGEYPGQEFQHELHAA